MLFALVAVSATMRLSAQDVQPINTNGHYIDVKIYFPYDEAYIDPAYMGNYETLVRVDSLLSDSVYVSTLRRVEISAQSSPEGTVIYNERLSARRIYALREYFVTYYPDIDYSIWSFSSVAENWDLFRQHLVEDENLPESERIMAIVDSNRDPDAKEWLLKTMDGGRPWEYIKKHILPSQRFGASILFIPVAYTPLALPAKVTNSLSSTPERETLVLPAEEPSKVLLAIRTNLVMDVASVVNLAVEVPIGERFSLAAEVVYPWWRSWPNNFTMQIESYHGEAKYWLGDRSRREKLTGWSVGLYGGWGRYDVQPFTEEGVQGEFYDFGAMVGYSLPLSNSFNLEFNLGFGYLDTEYKDYYMAYDTEEYGDIKVIPYPWMNNTLKAFIPTRGGISLVWNIKSKGGRR